MTATSTAIKLGGTALLAAGLVTGVQPAAFSAPRVPADAPTATANPSSGLSDGQVVQVEASGFAPNETLWVGQCADISPDTSVCDSEGRPSVSFTTDAGGNGSTSYTVHRTYDGYVVLGGHWGTVDCTVYSCYLGVGNDTHGSGTGTLSFQ